MVTTEYGDSDGIKFVPVPARNNHGDDKLDQDRVSPLRRDERATERNPVCIIADPESPSVARRLEGHFPL